MKLSTEFPPNIADIKKILGELPKGLVFCYGDTIFAPDSDLKRLDVFLITHEEVHSKQQEEMGPDKWWKLYLKSVDFRISQEVEAYQTQYKLAKRLIKDRNKLNLFLIRWARELASPAYGNILTFQDALEAIKAEKTFKFRVDI